MLNRRHMMFATAAAGFAATGGLPSLALAREGEAAKLNALFDDIMVKQLRQSPETATTFRPIARPMMQPCSRDETTTSESR